jgi:hypothetical protein
MAWSYSDFESLLNINSYPTGLVSLTVEFYRIETSDCTQDESGNSISTQPKLFPYNATTCGLTCSVEQGPFSPMRAGSESNIFVIPAPDKLDFGTATLLAGGCYIPAILFLISMWNRIVDVNWKPHLSDSSEDEQRPGGGASKITVENSRLDGKSLLRSQVSDHEAPVFALVVLCILLLGERNLLSTQVRYETETMISHGK